MTWAAGCAAKGFIIRLVERAEAWLHAWRFFV
jgi:hypothetical protein